MHTSGALSSEVLRPLQNEGFAVGSLHPLVAISDAQSGAEWLTRSFFSLEGDAAAIRFGRRIVRDLGGQSFTIDSGVGSLPSTRAKIPITLRHTQPQQDPPATN